MSDEHGYSSADGVAALLKELASRTPACWSCPETTATTWAN